MIKVKWLGIKKTMKITCVYSEPHFNQRKTPIGEKVNVKHQKMSPSHKGKWQEKKKMTLKQPWNGIHKSMPSITIC